MCLYKTIFNKIIKCIVRQKLRFASVYFLKSYINNLMLVSNNNSKYFNEIELADLVYS